MLRLVVALVLMSGACAVDVITVQQARDSGAEAYLPFSTGGTLGSGGQSGTPDALAGAGGQSADAWLPAGTGGTGGTGGAQGVDAGVASGSEVQADTRPAGYDASADVLVFSPEAGHEAAAGPDTMLPKCAGPDYGGCVQGVSPKEACKLATYFDLPDGGHWPFLTVCPALCGLCLP
jgi:hypothetical protein